MASCYHGPIGALSEKGFDAKFRRSKAVRSTVDRHRWAHLRADYQFISSNWRGEPLRDYETIVRLIAHTTTAKGLRVTCHLDRRSYPVGRKISDEEYAWVNLKPHSFHGEWNYLIQPKQKSL